MGIKTAQMALFGGANDVGSTMMEENVVSASGTTKFSASEMELQHVIRRAGFTPRRRDSDYVLLETPYLGTKEESIPSPIPTQS
jgi:cyclic dehypoxanthinyl futalosine synthase